VVTIQTEAVPEKAEEPQEQPDLETAEKERDQNLLET
jgi:hypothetical protein